MNVFKIIVFIICALMLCGILKSVKSSISDILLIFVSVTVFLFICTQLEPVLTFASTIAEKAGIDDRYMNIILKSIGICFLGDFAAQLCRDCGQNSLAQNAELVCKCSILTVALPMYIDIFNIILKLWENT